MMNNAMLIVIVLSVLMLNDAMLSVIVLSAVRLNVVAPRAEAGKQENR